MHLNGHLNVVYLNMHSNAAMTFPVHFHLNMYHKHLNATTKILFYEMATKCLSNSAVNIICINNNCKILHVRFYSTA